MHFFNVKCFHFLALKGNISLGRTAAALTKHTSLERNFQAKLIKELKEIFPGCIIMKNDPNYIQGICDLIILYGDRWATLECKKSRNAIHQPNQDYYVSKMDEMSFSRFICPENKEEVLRELQSAFGSGR